MEQKEASEGSSLLFFYSCVRGMSVSTDNCFTHRRGWQECVELRSKCKQNNAEYGAHWLASADNLRKWDGEKERRQNRDLEVY